MDFPFFGNRFSTWSRPRYEQSLRGIPVQVQPKSTPPPQPMKPKVVAVPVHFVGSERGRSDSAVRIQKVFRGFLVRENIKKIKAIREEVNDIERRVSMKETVDLIRNDSKERLKINEMLMSLLFKLDSVRGVDSGVRGCRKSVIKKAIALQELVDAIVSADQSLDSNNAIAVAETETVDQNQGITDSADNCNQTPELQKHDEITNKAEFMPNLSESEVIPQNQETVESSKEIVANQEDEESTETGRPESQTDSSANPESVDEEEEAALEENETRLADGGKAGKNSSKEECGENKSSKELLERMMQDNEKMMGLMAELFERNEMQTRLLSGLSQRVEQLEKAFLCQKLRRKKRRSVAGSVDCVEKLPDVKKCGKR
ncbi:IQ motif [Theobroma cacao]|nr:IQ motif [Theobroma cacao]